MRLRLLFLVIALAGGALAQPVTRLECGVPVDSYVDANSPKQRFLFSVTEPNDVIALRVVSTGATPESRIRVYTTLWDPSNLRLSPRLVWGPEGQIAEYELTDAGDYLVEVQANSPALSGSFRILRTRMKGPCAGASLTCGVPAPGEIAGIAEVKSFRFAGEKGDRFSVRMVKTTQVKTGDDRAATFALAVYDAEGKLAMTLDDKPAAFSTAASLKVDLQLSVTGVYTILVFEFSSGRRFGAVSVLALRLNGGCPNSKPAACGLTAESTLAEPLAADSYTIRASAGDVFLVRRTRTDSAGTLRLAAEVYAPDGRAVVPDPSSDATRLSFSAAVTGTYNLLIADDIRIDGKQTGRYAIYFARVNNPCNAQPLECGSVSQGRIEGVMRFSAYSIAAENNDAFLVRLLRADLNTSFKPRLEIYDPQGRLVQIGSTTDLARFTFKASAAGVYTVLAGDGLDGTRTGSYSVSLARLNRPCNAAPLGCASLVTGAIGGPLQFTSYAYTAAAGESFTVRMLDPNGSLQEALEVYDPEGNPAGTSVPGNVQAVDVARPAAGAYTILAMDAGKTAGQGPFSIQLFRTRNACAPPAAPGAALRGVVTGSAPFTAYSLPAAAGDAMLVRSASLTENFTPGMDLYDAEGARVASGTFSLSAAVKTAGDYTLILGASAPRTAGAYALSWQAMNRPANLLPLGCGETAGGALSPAAQFRYYSAAAGAGDTLRLLLTRLSDNFRPQLELYDPSGKRLVLTTTDITRKVADAGNYVVMVSPGATTAETGGYALAFQKTNAPCAAAPLACGQSVLRTAEAPGQLDAITFTGAAGERMALRLPTRSGNFLPYIELYDPAGTLVQSGALASLTRVLPATGHFALLVRDRSGAGAGSYRVTLQREPDACPVTDEEKPSIRLRRPTGGEVLTGGSPFRIQWESDDNVDVTSHEIRLSTDGGATFPLVLATGLAGASQSYDWQVPANVAPGRTAVIQVTATDAAGNSASAASGLLALLGSGFTPNGAVTFEYDGLNRVSKARYEDGLLIEYTYDAAGNLIEVRTTRP